MNLGLPNTRLVQSTPLVLRLILAVVFLLGTILNSAGAVHILVVCGCTVLYLLLGTYQLRLTRLLLLVVALIPLVVGLATTGFDFKHPFIPKYISALFYLVAIAIFLDSIRLEEWIWLLRQLPAHLSPYGTRLIEVLFAVGVGSQGVSQAVQRDRAVRKMAAVRRWATVGRINLLLDEIALPFRSALESVIALDQHTELLRRRREALESTQSEPAIGDSAKLLMDMSRMELPTAHGQCQLGDVYDFPLFTELMGQVFSSEPITTQWRQRIMDVPTDAIVLEIGPGSGRLTKELAIRGMKLRVIESHEGFLRYLEDIQRAFPGTLEILPGRFPSTTVEENQFVVLHQNVFLELVNQKTAGSVLQALWSACSPGGRVLFDYPISFSGGANGVLQEGVVPGVGVVDYTYECHSNEGAIHRALLNYKIVVDEMHTHYVRAQLEFRLPLLSDVLMAATACGFEIESRSAVEMFSFFPSTFELICLKRRA